MIEILAPRELAQAKETGALVGGILQTLKGRAAVGTNLLDIDQWTKDLIVEAGAQSCYVDYEASFAMGTSAGTWSDAGESPSPPPCWR